MAASLALPCACHLVVIEGSDGGDAGDAAPQDGAHDGEAGAVSWLTVCKQYYAQPGVASSSCTDCENGACGPETVASISACGDSPDSVCLDMCKGATPDNEDCTCLAVCLSAACETAMESTDSCQLAACGSSCN
jgi:hypothetical protein